MRIPKKKDQTKAIGEKNPLLKEGPSRRTPWLRFWRAAELQASRAAGQQRKTQLEHQNLVNFKNTILYVHFC